MRPDVVVILVDDMGWSDLGCYGGEIHTPNLDALAAGGVRYTQFYNCARCCPTRAALLTGLYPHRAGIGHMTAQTSDALRQSRLLGRPALPRLPERPHRDHRRSAPPRRLPDLHVRQVARRQLPPALAHGPRLRPLRRHAVRRLQLLAAERAGRPVGDDEPVTDLPPDFYTTDWFSERAARFVAEADPDRPYFLYLGYNAPHWPLHAWPEDIARYRGAYTVGWDEIRRRRLARQKELGLFPDDLPLSPRDPECPPWEAIDRIPDAQGRTFTADEWDLRMAVYAAMIDRMDQGIGRLLDQIRRTRDLDNTVIMFASDNGACAESWDPVPDVPAGPKESYTACFLPWANASNTPFRLFKHWLHEGGSATPFIFHYPNQVGGGRIESRYYAHVKDIMATCLDLTGAPYPSHVRGYPTLPLDSRSLLPNLSGAEADNPETLYLEHEGNRAVRRGKWKLVSYYGEARGYTRTGVGKGERTGPWELYDLEADRVELNDLSAAEPALRDKLIEDYGRFSERTGVSDWQDIQRELERLYRE